MCLGTTGPGAIHLMNGLYDSHYDGAPVLAITGTTFHDLIGTRFMQGVDTVKLMEPVAALNVQITGPAHALIVVNQACRTALGNRWRALEELNEICQRRYVSPYWKSVVCVGIGAHDLALQSLNEGWEQHDIWLILQFHRVLKRINSIAL